MKYLYFLPILLLLSCGNKKEPIEEIPMIVGTYTGSGSYGVYSLAFDQENGSFRIVDSLQAVNPSFLIFSPDRTKIYSVNEVEDDKAGVSAIAFDAASGKMSLINGEATESGAPCYLATNGKFVSTANYSGGTMSILPLSDDGKLLPIDTLYSGSIGGPDTTRQELPHLHCTVFSPDGKYLFASDFSADRLLTYQMTEDGRKVEPLKDENGEQIVLNLDPDYGPRHIIFDEKGKHGYVIGELSGHITVMDYNEGRLSPVQVVDADPYDGRGSADIRLSHDNQFLYASNRLKGDGITIFSVEPDTGLLSYVGYQSTGIHPRNFNITPNDKFLLVACRDTNEIEIYERDPESGLLTRTSSDISIPAPVCIEF